MRILPQQDIKIGDTVSFESRSLVAKDLYTDGATLRMMNPAYIMPHRRGYFLLEESNG